MRRDRIAFLHFAAQIVRSLAGFGTTLLAARYFGAAGLGVYSQVLALLFWLKLPSNSLTSAISKRMSESNDNIGYFSTGLAITLGYGVLVGAVVVLLEEVVNSYFGAEAAHLLVLLLLVNIVFDTIKSGLIGQQRVAVAGWAGALEQVARISSQVLFIIGGAMVLGLVYGHILSLAVFSIMGAYLFRDRLRLPSWDSLHELRTFAQYSWLGNLKSLAVNWMDILVLGLFVADDLVGIYQASWTLASFLALANKSITTTLFPELSELGSEEQYDQAKQLVEDALMFTGIFLIPGLFGALVIGDRVLKMYSGEFAAGATILVLLIGARMINEFGGQFMNALNGLNHPDIAFRINFVFFTSNIVLNVTLVYLFGWYGAAVATFSSSAIMFVLAWFALGNVLGRIAVPVRVIGAEIVASVVMAGVLLVMLPVVPRNLFVTLSAVLSGAAIYAVVLLGISARIRLKIRTLIGI